MRLAGRNAILIWIAFLAASIWIASRAQYTADMSAFLPRSPTASQQILVDQLREGVVSRLLLIGITGTQVDQLAAISQELTQQLSQDPHTAYVNNGAEDRLTADGEFLFRHRYLLSPGVRPERFTVEGLREALENALDLLASPLGTFISRILPADPTGELVLMLEELQPEGGPQKRSSVWFSRDGKRALLVLQTRPAGFDLDAQERVHAKVRSAFAQIVVRHGAAQAKLEMSGPGVFAVKSRASIKEDVSRISLFAIALICGLLLVVYRSPRVLILTLLPVVTGAFAGIAAVALGFGSVHGVTLGFGVTLLGEGVDYSIYLFTNAGAANRGRTLARIWPTLRLGVMTSVVGFGVLLLSDFTGLAQLGLFSIVGLVVAFAVTRYVLPLLAPAGLTVTPVQMLGPRLQGIAHAMSALRWPVIALIFAAGVWLVVRGASLWDDRLESLSPVSEQDKRLDESLRKELGAPDVGQMVVITARSQQEALEVSEVVEARLDRLRQSGDLEGYDSPTRILPSFKTQQSRQAALPESEALRRNLVAALRGLPFQAGLFEPFLKDVEAAGQAPLVSRNDLQGTGLALRVDSLLMERRGGWNAFVSLRDLKNRPAIAQALQGIESVHLLNMREEADALYRGYRTQALVFALVGSAAIALLLFLALRSIRRTVEVLLPLAAAVIVTCAVLTLGKHQLTMFHLVGLLLVVGVGSNYTLFFERDNLARSDPHRTLTSLVLCNACTVIGFGLLALARAPVLHAIGATVAIGTFLSLVFAAVLESRKPSGV